MSACDFIIVFNKNLMIINKIIVWTQYNKNNIYDKC